MLRISRRDFIKTTIAGSIGTTVLTNLAKGEETTKTMTHYIAAYDTESSKCLAGCRKIVDIHRRYEMPATFFIVGKTLEANPNEYKELLNDPLFEVASHTYSHQMLRDHAIGGKAVSEDKIKDEILLGKSSVESVFERPCIGVRSGWGFDKGLVGAPIPLKYINEAGFQYVSTKLWGPDFSLPALLTEPFNYTADSYPKLWELPGHGWHENILKKNTFIPQRLTLWPPPMPEAIPKGFITTPQEEFAINRIFLEKAVESGNSYVSLIWHPWSLYSFDPEMKMLELTFTHVRELGLKPYTYADIFHKVSGL
jgi:peptidoglycan/xylan/chitin deacetylase (PgdA/CDA1 family)